MRSIVDMEIRMIEADEKLHTVAANIDGVRRTVLAVESRLALGISERL